jgi:hypothetical protein
VSSQVSESARASNVRSRRWWIASLCLVCAIAIALLCWASRYSINPDGISYLDIADQLQKGHFDVLLHPYWSPLYPCILAIALKLFSPGPATELLVVHFVNFVIALGSLAAFTFFVVKWSQLQGVESDAENSLTSFRLQSAFAYALFLWAAGEMIGLAPVTPDLCVAAIVFLTAGLCCRLANSRGAWITATLLGLSFSFGYFSKAAMLPLSVVLLAILSVPRLFVLPRRSLLALSALVFFITTGPLVFLLSRQEHHLTFGESGRLNYAWLVLQQVPLHQGWTTASPETGTPLHPPRVINLAPTVLEFKNTVPGTYPLWYNPAFFYQGLRTHFDWRKQRGALLRSLLTFVVSERLKQFVLFTGFIALFILTMRRRSRVDYSRSWLALWALAAFGMYVLVAIEPRYIAAFLVLFWIEAYGSVLTGVLNSSRALTIAVIGVVTACIFLSQLHLVESEVTGSLHDSHATRQIVVATELARLGLHPGDEIVTVGDGSSAYYARLAQLRVVATIGLRGGDNDRAQFWSLSDNKSADLKLKLREVGARAIVSDDAAECSVASNQWHSIKDTGVCVEFLD